MGENQDLGAADDQAKESLPALWEMLTVTQVGRDLVRTPARLSIAGLVGGFAVTISDPDLKRSKSISVVNLADALQAIDQAIADNSIPWRQWGKGEPQLRKRRPRP